MTPEEAIIANETLAIELDATGQDRLAKGVRLGNEALKREIKHREWMTTWDNIPLPGETEE